MDDLLPYMVGIALTLVIYFPLTFFEYLFRKNKNDKLKKIVTIYMSIWVASLSVVYVYLGLKVCLVAATGDIIVSAVYWLAKKYF
jgi:hypothetical protein